MTLHRDHLLSSTNDVQTAKSPEVGHDNAEPHHSGCEDREFQDNRDRAMREIRIKMARQKKTRTKETCRKEARPRQTMKGRNTPVISASKNRLWCVL